MTETRETHFSLDFVSIEGEVAMYIVAMPLADNEPSPESFDVFGPAPIGECLDFIREITE